MDTFYRCLRKIWPSVGETAMDRFLHPHVRLPRRWPLCSRPAYALKREAPQQAVSLPPVDHANISGREETPHHD